MLCRACQDNDARGGDGDSTQASRRERRKSAPRTLNTTKHTDRRVRDQLCSRCGHLVGPDDTTRKVRAKQSQLARFGLAGPRSPLLRRKHREDR